MRRAGVLGAACAAIVTAAAIGLALAQGECGSSAKDWCAAPAGDPCGRHRNEAECRADFKCYGVPFRGQAKIGCVVDRRGFSLNCPIVGCRSTPPEETVIGR